jgi:guanylate kinase
MPSAPGKLIVLSGPSGAGKTTLRDRLLKRNSDQIERSVSATTRQPRPGEVDGVDYHFLTAEEFQRRRAAGEFLESAQVYPDLWYGTLKSEVATRLAAGKSVLLEIDVQGCRQVVGQNPAAVTIFVQPVSLEELERRLRERRTEDAASLARRLDTARQEMAAAASYHYRVVNEDLDRASEELQNIIRKVTSGE